MRDQTQSATTTPPAPGWPQEHMLEAAMGLICNVGQGNWLTQTEEWRTAAMRWMAAYSTPPTQPPSSESGMEPQESKEDE